VDATGDGEEGLWFAESFRYDLLVLDIMLPGMDGLSILDKLRNSGSNAHVLIITARDTVSDRVKGLDLGADDYLVKPFAFEEFLARVRALLRRAHLVKSPVVGICGVSIDTRSRTAMVGGKFVPLTSREFSLLELLMLNAGSVVSRNRIWESLFDFASENDSNVIEVYISNIRRKLREAGGKPIIHTRRGAGYIIEERDK
jgi:DNA-binding response OmpR family regulator